jgi:hypothetical protein
MNQTDLKIRGADFRPGSAMTNGSKIEFVLSVEEEPNGTMIMSYIVVNNDGTFHFYEGVIAHCDAYYYECSRGWHEL